MSRATLVIVFILTGFSGSHGAQELSPLWVYESQDKIEYFEVTPSGDLFVSSKSEIALVSAKTGEVAWSRDDIRDCKRSSSPYVGGMGPIRSPFYDDAAEELVVCRYLNKRGSEFIVLSNTPYALFGPKERVAVLDWRTGTTLFDSADHPLGKVRKLRYIAQLAQFVLWAEIKKNSYALASIKAGDSGLQWLSETTISKDFEWLGVQGDVIKVPPRQREVGLRVASQGTEVGVEARVGLQPGVPSRRASRPARRQGRERRPRRSRIPPSRSSRRRARAERARPRGASRRARATPLRRPRTVSRRRRRPPVRS